MRLNLKRLGLLAGRAARLFALQVGLTPQRLDLLFLVRDAELTQREIAERLCVSPPVVSRMLQALEHDDLVYRTVDPRDPRAKLTHLTAGGRQRVDECFAPDARYGAQATGEALWLAEWRARVAPLGLRVDSILRARAPRYFTALARWRPAHTPELRTAPPITDAHDPVLVKMITDAGIDYDLWSRGLWVFGAQPS